MIELLTEVYFPGSRRPQLLPALVEGYYWVPLGWLDLSIYGPDGVQVGGAYARQDLVEVARRYGVYVLQGLAQERETLSDWIPVEGHCATRVVEGTDPDVISNRRAFIEKSARVCLDGEWISLHKGRGGSEDPETHGLYGFDPESRAAADRALVDLGYVLGSKISTPSV